MTLKELRLLKGLSQQTCANYLGISLRTYVRYEKDEAKRSTVQYRYLTQELEKLCLVDETHGILTIEKIKSICNEIFQNFKVQYCYLFGSYAKGKATDSSDIDLLVSTNLNGLEYFELLEELREKLKKKVDVLHLTQLNENPTLMNEILQNGIKIYG